MIGFQVASEKKVAMVMFDDTKKIGTFLLMIGGLFMVLGVLLFFDSGLIGMGDLLFLSGLTMTIGVKKTIRFFSRKDRWRGIVTFIGGILLVFWGWSVFGVLLQGFGFINLFGSFFPIAISFLRHTPVIGQLLALPYISKAVDMLAGVGGRGLPV